MRVYVLAAARNEADNLKHSIPPLLNQTVETTVCVVNDGSTDETGRLLSFLGVNRIVHLPPHGKSYVAHSEESWKMARVLNSGLPVPESYDFLMLTSPDIVVPQNYCERLAEKMKRHSKLVIASGSLDGERVSPFHPRGVGRMVKTWFWKRHITRFPEIMSYENYPVYKAQALGYETRNFPDIHMKGLRPTQKFKAAQGFIFRDAGFFPPSALIQLLRYSVKHHTPVSLINYVKGVNFRTGENFPDSYIKRLHRRRQAKRLLRLGG